MTSTFSRISDLSVITFQSADIAVCHSVRATDLLFGSITNTLGSAEAVMFLLDSVLTSHLAPVLISPVIHSTYGLEQLGTSCNGAIQLFARGKVYLESLGFYLLRTTS